MGFELKRVQIHQSNLQNLMITGPLGLRRGQLGRAISTATSSWVYHLLISSAPYLLLNFSIVFSTALLSITDLANISIDLPETEMLMEGFFRIFLYQLVSEPDTGKRCIWSSAYTNHTIVSYRLPVFLPLKSIVSSLFLDNSSLRLEVPN